MASLITSLCERARQASRLLAVADTVRKNQALTLAAQNILQSEQDILSANDQDVQVATDLSDAMRERLLLTPKRIASMAAGLREVAGLPDPVGQEFGRHILPSGIDLGKMRVSLGVVGMIYESRPNVTADAAGLCIKSGNAAVLRGGSEALHSNTRIVECMRAGLRDAELPEDAVQLLGDTDRALITELVGDAKHLDMVIPRGGAGLVKHILQHAQMPVLQHLEGVCQLYIDEGADEQMAAELTINSKARRFGVCNALETLLVHSSMTHLIPRLHNLLKEKGVEVRGCERARAMDASLSAATEQDWSTEYLGPVLALRVVDGLEHAIEHINTYGSGHTDSIVTSSEERGARFLREVDSGSVMLNAPTSFADGHEYGLGAEIGISTSKFHARGPVGLEGLTSCKYVVRGHGEVRP